MGYQTRHAIEIFGEDVDLDKHKHEIGVLSEYGDWLFEDSVKWYDCDDDMVKHSKRYPDLTFVINGEGEQPDDIWTAYYKNGLYYRGKATIYFPSFDPKKLNVNGGILKLV